VFSLKLAPLTALAAGGEGVINKALYKAVQHGKELLVGFIQRTIPGKGIPKPKVNVAKKETYYSKQVTQPLKTQQRSLISNYLKNYANHGLASKLGRDAARQMWSTTSKGTRTRLRYLGQRVTMYGFVGVSLAGMGTKDQEFDPVPMCKHIAELFSAVDYTSLNAPPMGKKVDDYDFGQLIATGCDAAVYEAQPSLPPTLQLNLDENESEHDNFTVISDSEEHSFEVIPDSGSPSFDMMSAGSGESFDVISDNGSSLSEHSINQESVGIKVMFNYGVESNAAAIEAAMERELVPVVVPSDKQDSHHLCGSHVKKKRLPPHPNIARLYGYFVDQLPLLDAAHCMYPMALPPRLHEEGFGRNSTMFIVMKRYDCSLADYLQEYGPCGTREGVLLLLQLVTGIQHMQKHLIAHRDLKSDNILLDDTHTDSPKLVVSDFGHCLVGDARTHGLCLPYISSCMDKGGNGKLMAPEISTAHPGPTALLDFRRSDLWAAGTLAFEIFAGANPFYTDLFDSRNYSKCDLPKLPASVPNPVARVVYNMLERDPRKRFPPGAITNLLALTLWAPEDWKHTPPCDVTLIRWLVAIAAKQRLLLLLHRDSAEAIQLGLFLANLDWEELKLAVGIYCGE